MQIDFIVISKGRISWRNLQFLFICTFPILSIVLKPMLIQIRFWFLLCTLYNRVMRIIKKKFASKLNKCFLRPFGKCKRSSWKVIHYTILKLYYIRIYCKRSDFIHTFNIYRCHSIKNKFRKNWLKKNVSFSIVYYDNLSLQNSVWTTDKGAILNRGRWRNKKNVLKHSPIPKCKRLLWSHLNWKKTYYFLVMPVIFFKSFYICD